MKKILTLLSSALLATSAWAQNMENGHEYVDLGLTSGTLWATCNIGADAPENYGDYYQWGEVTTHYSAGGNTDSPTWKEGYSAGYNWSTYKWCNGSYKTQTKYVPQSYASKYGYEGFYDDKVTLENADDVASQTWGGSWLVPTHAQQEELYNECYWVWTNSYNGTGVHGYIVYKAKADDDKGTIVYDGNTPSSSYSLSDVHIFLPAAGDRWDTDLYDVGDYGYYWSSSLHEYDPLNAWGLFFSSYSVSPSYIDYRNLGFSVRPVCMVEKTPTAVESINTDNASKVTKTIENGRVVIIRDGVRYDITGRKL